ncbi:MAG TPA: hypothetical protein VFW51_00625 [Actinomycetota bacterium]|nr:hypothetical protein [Actinomycetota bacterium]
MPELSLDISEVYAMVTEQKPADPGAWERQRTRQVRTMWNRRIGAFALTAAMVVAAVAVILGTTEQAHDVTLGTQPPATPVEVATNFLGAYAAFDADRALTYMADDAEVSELVLSIGSPDLGGPSGIRLAISYLEAVGYEQIVDSCEQASVGPSGALVRCSFDLHLLRSHEIGLGPFGPAELDLSVVDGEIVRVSSMSFDHNEAFSPEVWEPFAEWVSTNYPGDAARMYVDETHSSTHLTPRSIRLWERHTREYVLEVETNG